MTDHLILDEEVDEALERARRDFGSTRSDAVRAIVQDWLETHGYLPADELDELCPLRRAFFDCGAAPMIWRG